MKFNVPGKVFQQQLQAVSRVINSKNALAILDNFLIRLDGDRLWITGSDSENVMTSWLEVTDSEGEGALAVPSKTIIDIAKEIGNQPIRFEVNDDTLEVSVVYQNGHFNLMAINADEYPRKTAEETERKEFTLPAQMVTKGIENTLYAVSTDQLRPMMTGIFWDIDTDGITFVSSDTHKLVKYVNRQAAPGFKGGFILPAKPAAILKSIITSEDTEVMVSMDERGATFRVGSFELTCKFVKGVYPNYNRVIPTQNPFRMTVDRTSFLNAVRRVALSASKATCLVKIDIDATRMHLVGRDLDYSTEAEENVDCNYEGNPMTIGFNSGYMLDILGNLKGDDVELCLSDPARPGIFRPLMQEPDEDITILQMPMQVME